MAVTQRNQGSGAKWLQGSRRRALAALAVLSVASLLVLATLFSVSLRIETARADLEARLGELAGEPVRVEGSASFRLLPRPYVTLSDVRVGREAGDGGPSVRIDHVLAQLDYLDAFRGRTDIARLTFVRPEIAGFDRWAGPGEALAPSDGAQPQAPSSAVVPGDDVTLPHERAAFGVRAFLTRFAGVRALDIREGVFRSADGMADLSDMNVDFTWPSPREAARLAGSYVWNGEPTRIDLALAAPDAFLSGRPSVLTLSVSAPPIRVDFQGEGSLAEGVTLAGTLDVATPSLAHAVRWLRHDDGTFPDFGAFALQTQVTLSGSRADLAGARIDLDGALGHGALEVGIAVPNHPAVGGTLAFERLDLDRLARAIAPPPRHALDLQRRIDLSFFDDLDLDLRLSAGEAVLAGVPLRQLAATVKLAAGAATVDVGDAELLGGRALARLSVDASADRPQAQARLALNGVDAAGLAELAGIRTLSITGRSDLQADFAGPVGTWADLLGRSAVDGELRIRVGTVAGIDASQFVEPGTRVLSAREPDTPATFSVATARARTLGMVAHLEELHVETEQGDFLAAGILSLAAERVSVQGSFRPRETPEDNEAFTTSQPVGFTMQGEWPHPTLTVASGV